MIGLKIDKDDLNDIDQNEKNDDSPSKVNAFWKGESSIERLIHQPSIKGDWNCDCKGEWITLQSLNDGFLQIPTSRLIFLV